jgi:phosphatidylglycerol:prolipoprotein diacylglycerol transferase
MGGQACWLPQDTMVDIALYATPIAIICARIYFVFWNFKDYKDNLLSIFAIWEGGIAIYGGIIGGVATAYIYCRIKKIPWTKVFDVGAMGLLIGQIIGRWGNFVNVEAYGSETNLPWRMEIMNTEVGRIMSVHPTFLYESLWNLAGLIGLFFYRKHKKYDGEIFLLYATWYGLGRMWIEQLRVDSLPYTASFKISQIVAGISAIIGISLIIYFKNKFKKEQNI